MRLSLDRIGLEPYARTLAPEGYESLRGTITSFVELQLPADAESQSEAAGHFNGSIHQLQFRNETIGDLSFNGNLTEGQLAVSAEGEVLGGTAELTVEISEVMKQLPSGWLPGGLPPAEPTSDSSTGEEGEVEIDQLQNANGLDARIDATFRSIELGRVYRMVRGQAIDAAGRGELRLRAQIVDGKLQSRKAISLFQCLHMRARFLHASWN